MLGRCPSSILQSTHPFLHSSIYLPIHSSIHPVIYTSIPPSIHLFLHPSIYHPSIHPPIHQSIQPSIHLPTLSSTSPLIHLPITVMHSSIHAYIHLLTYSSLALLASPPSHIPPLLHTSILSFPHAIHMLHFQTANKTQSLPSESLRPSDDLHDPRPTRLLLGQCLPRLAGPPFGLGHLQSEDSQTRWMAFTLSLHLYNLFFCLLYYSSKVGQGSG